MTITKIVSFSAAHRFKESLRGDPDAETGMVMNLSEVKAILQERVLNRLDHSFINESVSRFRAEVPTAENLVLYIRDELMDAFPLCTLHRVRLWETDDFYAEWEEGPC